MNEQDKPTTVRYWLALALVALALRIAVACLLFGNMPDASDPLVYAKFARQMVDGTGKDRVYEWTPGRSYAIVPFFWAFGTSSAVVRANSIFFDVACVLLAAAVGHQVLRRRSAARLSGWVAAFYPPAIMLSGLSYTMNVTMCGLLASTWLALLGWRRIARDSDPRLRVRLVSNPRLRFGFSWAAVAAWFAAGACLGFAILTRPSSASIALGGGAVWLGVLLVNLSKPNLLSGAARSTAFVLAAGIAFLFGAAACIAPVLKRQHDLGAGWCIAANNELIFFNGNNPYTPLYKTWHLGSQKVASPEYTAYMATFDNQPDRRSAMFQATWQHIAARPDLFLLRTANRLRAFWGFDYLASANVKEAHWGGRARLLVCLAAEGGGYCLTMLLIITGLFVWRRVMSGGHALLLVALALAYQAPYVLTYACGSYRVPVMGFLSPFAGLALDEIHRGGGEFWQALKRRTWFWIAVGLFLVIQVEYAYFILASHSGVGE